MEASDPTFVAPAVALPSGAEVAVYGAGPAGRDACAALAGAGCVVRAVLDRRAASLPPVSGLPVGLPDAEAARRLRDIPLVLAVFNREVDVLALARSLRAAGFGPFVSFVALHAHLGGRLADRFWLARRDSDAASPDEDAARGLFADDASRSLFDALLAFRRTGDYRVLPVPKPDSIYLPDDVPGWLRTRPVRLLDGGAFDGDTLERFRRAGVPIAAAACFEPDAETFARLTETVLRVRDEVELYLWPSALAASSGRLRFAGGLGESSRVDPAGGSEVMCIAVDEALPSFAPTLVKLDVEGAEEDALTGMTRTLARHRPDLAVSVYHLPAHLTTIPIQIAGLGAGYRFYLRSHGHNGFDVVLYATV